ncbi:MAG: pyruvate kinase [Hyphomicrobiales bacterium]|nr:pyruvate kinase [Hyphomicrobiales bacterium]
MQRTRRVKILATLGPSSSTKEQIRNLFDAGADIFRINMSHSSHETLAQLVSTIREIEGDVERPIGILADLQGPKHRLGKFKNDKISVISGDRITFDSNPAPGDKSRVHLPHPEILEALSTGHRVIVDDGKVLLNTLECDGKSALLEVVSGKKLSNRKGVSLPDTDLPLSAMTDKDIADLHAALEVKADWIALSFVQRPADLVAIRKIVRGRAGIMSKIEKPQAVARLDEIIELSDSVMVARGDLGVELPIETVPGLQKRIVRACRQTGKPVIVATQMLESMINAAVPTRAEVSDVATAVFEGVDAVMLSAESAVGDYPVEAVSMMNSIAEQVEQDQTYSGIITTQRSPPEPTGADAISAASRQIVETLDLSAIVCYTASGTTGLRAARERPSKPIIALSPVTATARRLALVWGLHCVITEDARDLDDMVDRACRIAHREQFANPGDRVIIIAGVPLRTPGSTNSLRIAYISSDGQSGI